MSLTVAVAREMVTDESRIALVPEVADKFAALGASVLIEKGAGDGALIPDKAFTSATLSDRADVLSGSDLLLCVQPPDLDTLRQLKRGSMVAGFLSPYGDPERIKLMRDNELTSFSVELIPRISRAQSMDALSSQASIAGYKAVLIASQLSGRFFPMLTTAAGTIRPSKVLVIGAGVAGLQALATARRLGAMTEGYDVRPETREQVESLGAKFLDVSVSAAGEGGYARELTEEEKAQQQQMLAEHLAKANVIITTAAIPGKQSPRIISRDMVEQMQPGTVIVDLAAEGGGNCELTEAGKTIQHESIIIDGPVNLASQLPVDASQMFARNLYSYLSPAISDGEFVADWEDEIFASSVVTHEGRIMQDNIKERVEG